MSKKVFEIEGLKLGLTSREIKAVINNVEELAYHIADELLSFPDFVERGLHQIKEMWENSPEDIKCFKRNFKYKKRVMNRQRI